MSRTGRLYSSPASEPLRWPGNRRAGHERPQVSGSELNAAILNSVSDRMAILDRAGVILAVNQAWLLDGPRFASAGQLPIVGTNYVDICLSGSAPEHGQTPSLGEAISAVCTGANPSLEREYVCHAPEGEQWWLLTVTPFPRRAGGAIVMHRNVTSLRRAELSLRQSEARLREGREVEQRLREISGRLIAAQEDERRRLARELHDDLSQTLALLTIELEQLCIRPPAAAEALTGRLREVWQRATDLTGQVRVLSHHIHPSRLEALGLVASLRGYCREFGVRHGLTLDFAAERMPADIPSDAALCAYRIVQETLRNVVKHSAAAEAMVELDGVPGGFRLRITDSGVGFDPEAVAGTGLGLVSIRERLHLVGGTLTIVSTRGTGTRVDVYIPLADTTV